MANNTEYWNTPEGIAIYPRLNQPDTKFDPNGTFSVNLRLNAEDGAELVKKLEARLDAFHSEEVKRLRKPTLRKAALPYNVVVNDDGVETGEYDFKFKMKHNVTTRTGKSWTQRPKIVDAQLKGFVGPIIGSGSKLVVQYAPQTYYTPTMGCGVTLRLNAVQVIELKEYESKGGSNFGFAAKEGGFTASEETLIENGATAEEETPKQDANGFSSHEETVTTADDL